MVCKICRFWEKNIDPDKIKDRGYGDYDAPNDESFGRRFSEKFIYYKGDMPEKNKDSLYYYDDFASATFWVGEYFGCIHHKNK